ncbi:MAG TPA: hypothetical protein VGC47_08125 [Acidimicrobiia bacterium]
MSGEYATSTGAGAMVEVVVVVGAAVVLAGGALVVVAGGNVVLVVVSVERLQPVAISVTATSAPSALREFTARSVGVILDNIGISVDAMRNTMPTREDAV